MTRSLKPSCATYDHFLRLSFWALLRQGGYRGITQLLYVSMMMYVLARKCVVNSGIGGIDVFRSRSFIIRGEDGKTQNEHSREMRVDDTIENEKRSLTSMNRFSSETTLNETRYTLSVVACH